MSVQQVDWDLVLIQKHSYSRPRYTSYPTALEFSEDFGEQAFLQAVARYPKRPLSFYAHIPFYHRPCYFCGCSKIVTRQQHKADQYLDTLEQEVVHHAPLFAERHISQLHWGGETPAYLNRAQINRLMELLRENFQFNANTEISVEVDPWEIELDVLDHLRVEGFNRLSMDVQGFSKEVQRLANREQNEEFIFVLLSHVREVGFTSTNIDLIYGLLERTLESFAFTLRRVTGLNPGRLSVFSYAHLSTTFAAQRRIRNAGLPSPQQKLDILQKATTFLTQSGYQSIDMDHFARPDDKLAVAQHKGVLHRNFQGYTTQNDTDLLGTSVSAINMIGDYYAQNQKEPKQYYQQVSEQGNALWRGIAPTRDGYIRRDVTKSLICNFRLDYAPIEKQWDLHFANYFAKDLKLLTLLTKDGLMDVGEKGIQVTAKGRLLIRNIYICFDTYLRQKVWMQQSSRAT